MNPPPPFFATLEPSSHSRNGTALVLYFEVTPADMTIRQACRRLTGRLPLSADPDSEFFAYDEIPTVLSKRARLHRIEVTPVY